VYSKQSQKIVDAVRLYGVKIVDIWNACGHGRVTLDEESLSAQTTLPARRTAA
jgi:hypothetical protein